MTSPVPPHADSPNKGSAAFSAVQLDVANAKRWLEASRAHLALNDRAAAFESRKRGLDLITVVMTRAEKFLTAPAEHALAQNAVLQAHSIDCELREHFARRGPIPIETLYPEDLSSKRALREQVYLAACHELLAQGLDYGEVLRQANLALANATRMHARHAVYPA